MVAQSIKRYGVINPVVVDRHVRIIAGHARVEASLQLGLPYIPVIQVDHLSETELRAYALADNALCDKSGWDREMLAIELGELIDLLPAEGFDVSLTGFEAAEIDLLLADMAPPRSQSRKISCQLCPGTRQRAAGICGNWENTGSCAAMHEMPTISPA